MEVTTEGLATGQQEGHVLMPQHKHALVIGSLLLLQLLFLVAMA